MHIYLSFLRLEAFLPIPPIESPLFARVPSVFRCPKSFSNPTRDFFRAAPLLLACREAVCGRPILLGREAFLADRMAAFRAFPSPTASSSSLAIFLRLAFLERPENLSRLGFPLFSMMYHVRIMVDLSTLTSSPLKGCFLGSLP